MLFGSKWSGGSKWSQSCGSKWSWRQKGYYKYMNIYFMYIYYMYILPANDLVRCGHTLENHTPMSWANIPLVVWVPYSYVITTNHRKHVIFKQVLQGYKALGNSGQFLSHDNCSYFAWKKWLADWLLHCRTRWHVYLVFFSLDCFKALLHTFAIETNLENVVK